MQRVKCNKRLNFELKLKDRSYDAIQHSMEFPYWKEDAYYNFTSADITILEDAANDLHAKCLALVGEIIEKQDFEGFNINPKFYPYITKSWNEDELEFYGRFDFAYDGQSFPKLLEYNADTPTSLYEASILQYDWLNDKKAQGVILEDYDQFNSIHEDMIERWKYLAESNSLKQGKVYFSCVSDIGEELLTTHYISTTAALAGLGTVGIDLSDIGHDDHTNEFLDLEDNTISNLFKLYPWEDLANNDYADKILNTNSIRFIEPSWKMLLSNKALLPKLYERFPDCPYLLRAYFSKDKFNKNEQYVEKALFGREGEGVTLFLNNEQEKCLSLEKGYGEEGYIYQEYKPLYQADGQVAVLGIWMIGDKASGLGVREDTSKITKNTSMFVPHCFS